MGIIISALAGWLWSAFRSKIFWLLVTTVFGDIIYKIVGDIFGMAVNAINSVGAITIPTLADGFAVLPPAMLQIMKRVGLDTCLHLLVTAYTIAGSLKLYNAVRGLKPRS